MSPHLQIVMVGIGRIGGVTHHQHRPRLAFEGDDAVAVEAAHDRRGVVRIVGNPVAHRVSLTISARRCERPRGTAPTAAAFHS
jgi:hypothetical protein